MEKNYIDLFIEKLKKELGEEYGVGCIKHHTYIEIIIFIHKKHAKLTYYIERRRALLNYVRLDIIINNIKKREKDL